MATFNNMKNFCKTFIGKDALVSITASNSLKENAETVPCISTAAIPLNQK
jgi:hypothetical protein